MFVRGESRKKMTTFADTCLSGASRILRRVTTLLMLADRTPKITRYFEAKVSNDLLRSRGDLYVISRNPIVGRYVWTRTCFGKIPLPSVIQFEHKRKS